MRVKNIHSWNVTPKEAVAIQKSLRNRLRLKPLGKPIRFVAGVDVSASRFGKDLFVCAVILDFPALTVKEFACAARHASFPYVPGLLSFREIPPVLDALKKIRTPPDLIICDGQGFAHPRRLGLASHLGLLLDVPTIGCAKTLLTGKYDEPARERGSFSYLFDKSEKIGAVLRTKNNVKPLFVSPGNNIDIERSVDIVLGCCRRYRLPRTTRQAHHLVNLYRCRKPLKPLQK